jgi:hypothetical protein
LQVAANTRKDNSEQEARRNGVVQMEVKCKKSKNVDELLMEPWVIILTVPIYFDLHERFADARVNEE